TVNEIAKSIDIQKVIPIIKSLVDKDIVITDEEIKDPFKPKFETYLSLADPYNKDEATLYALIDQLSSSKKTAKQADLILAFLMNVKKDDKTGHFDLHSAVKKNELLKNSATSLSRLNTLIDKGIFLSKDHKISRLLEYNSQDSATNIELSDKQQLVFNEILDQFTQQDTVLLHGVTGSGKTEIYIKLIDKVLSEGKQVLYLLPEIALTSQIVNRLRKYFGDRVGVYHSRFNEYERVEIWNRVLQHDSNTHFNNKYQLILGARSSLLLPYKELGLIIVDEEHDASYKQMDPAPRYHARDSAIVLSSIHHGKTLLGTATPSLESYYNVEQNKYGLVRLTERFAASTLPDIWIVNLSESMKQKKMHGHFSQFLLDHMTEALEKQEQIILFQNRRGFSLRLYCNSCQTMPTCIHCDVTLTYHKNNHLLKCHYCGYAIEVPTVCPHCKSTDIEMKGFGTEKIEESISELFPHATIARMDLDTTRSKNSYQKIISDFENHKTDILVGTQMVTKGLDFNRVSVVGILNADNLISFPDFRSFERAFQILSQVSGRAGRKDIPGKVIIQSYQPEHPALQYVVANDFNTMYLHQMEERKQFNYPPVCRMIKLTLKHKDQEIVNRVSLALAPILRKQFPHMVLGPESPLVSKIQNYYLKDFWIKLPKNGQLDASKLSLQKTLFEFQSDQENKSVRIIITVDA
ncbi:MAG: primosomal protein N', partial [Bacteroidales bacterium]